ncbi:MAG: hypothetical protein E6K54_06695 [Gammaproteobacteria bacterium]|nr:MAG: hypothetical protein E6K54_06695 [Gammaproteobacteria bacterium]
MISPINDYKLGKIDSKAFINKLQEIFDFLPPGEESVNLLKSAWNSFELNIQQIKQDIERATEKTWNWQKQTSGECHFQVYENFRLMTSYDNGVFKTDGLLENLVTQLVSEGHHREFITLVSQYQADLDKAKALGINSQKPNQFFPTGCSSKITPFSNARYCGC